MLSRCCFGYSLSDGEEGKNSQDDPCKLTFYIFPSHAKKYMVLSGVCDPRIVDRRIHQQTPSCPQSYYAAVSHGRNLRQHQTIQTFRSSRECIKRDTEGGHSGQRGARKYSTKEEKEKDAKCQNKGKRRVQTQTLTIELEKEPHLWTMITLVKLVKMDQEFLPQLCLFACSYSSLCQVSQLPFLNADKLV